MYNVQSRIFCALAPCRTVAISRVVVGGRGVYMCVCRGWRACRGGGARVRVWRDRKFTRTRKILSELNKRVRCVRCAHAVHSHPRHAFPAVEIVLFIYIYIFFSVLHIFSFFFSLAQVRFCAENYSPWTSVSLYSQGFPPSVCVYACVCVCMRVCGVIQLCQPTTPRSTASD